MNRSPVQEERTLGGASPCARMTRMIRLHVPCSPRDNTFLVDCAADHADEHLAAHKTLPASSLLTLDTITMVVTHNDRPIGALSTATGGTDTPRSEVDTLYIKPKYRGKGRAFDALAYFTMNCAHPPFLRGPLPAALEHLADRLGIDTGPHHDTHMLPMVTQAFLRTVPCPHSPEPCRSCIHTQLHQHFAAVVEQHDHLVKGIGA